MLTDHTKLKDAFISYSASDKKIVGDIVRAMRENNLDVWFDKISIEAGEIWIEAIEKGLEASRTLVLFLSPASLKSRMVQKEFRAWSTRMSEDDKLKLISVLLHDIQFGDLPLFLRSIQGIDLCKRNLNTPDQFDTAVAEIVQAVKGKQSTGVLRIPIVIFAMNQQEADGLLSKKVFDKNMHKAREDFELFAKKFGKPGMNKVAASYGQNREAWKPITASPSESIRDSIEDAVRRINNQQKNALPVKAWFLSDDFLSEQAGIREGIWNQLSKTGCIMIVDAISMFHPHLQERLGKSELGSNKKVSIVVLSPINHHNLPTNKHLEETFHTLVPRSFGRYHNELDLHCEFGLGNVHALKRWLATTLPLAAKKIRDREPHLDNLEKMKQQNGESEKWGSTLFGENPK